MTSSSNLHDMRSVGKADLQTMTEASESANTTETPSWVAPAIVLLILFAFAATILVLADENRLAAGAIVALVALALAVGVRLLLPLSATSTPRTDLGIALIGGVVVGTAISLLQLQIARRDQAEGGAVERIQLQQTLLQALSTQSDLTGMTSVNHSAARIGGAPNDCGPPAGQAPHSKRWCWKSYRAWLEVWWWSAGRVQSVRSSGSAFPTRAGLSRQGLPGAST